MYPIVFLAALALLAPLSANSANANKNCYDKAVTQYDLNSCSGTEYQLADKQLNSAYQDLLNKYSSDKKHVEKIRAAQRMWLKWRDAEILAIYPPEEAGSVLPMCTGMKLTEITKERIKQLRNWLDGGQEGDVCAY